MKEKIFDGIFWVLMGTGIIWLFYEIIGLYKIVQGR